MIFTAGQNADILESKKHSLPFLTNVKYTSHSFTKKISGILRILDFKAEQKLPTVLRKIDDSNESFSKLIAFYDTVKNSKVGERQFSYFSKRGIN